MTLSRWLRDYLYIPLGGNRGGQRRDVPQPDAHDGARRALARRGWTSSLWGALHGLGLCVEPAAAGAVASRAGAGRPSRSGGGAILVILGSAWAGSSSGPTTSSHRVDLIERGSSRPAASRVGTLQARARRSSSCIAVRYMPAACPKRSWRHSLLPSAARASLWRIAHMIIRAIGPQGAAPFIYFQF